MVVAQLLLVLFGGKLWSSRRRSSWLLGGQEWFAHIRDRSVDQPVDAGFMTGRLHRQGGVIFLTVALLAIFLILIGPAARREPENKILRETCSQLITRREVLINYPTYR